MCVHHWVIEPVNGTPYVMGVCRLCNESRQFTVSLPDPTAKPHMGTVFPQNIGVYPVRTKRQKQH